MASFLSNAVDCIVLLQGALRGRAIVDVSLYVCLSVCLSPYYSVLHESWSLCRIYSQQIISINLLFIDRVEWRIRYVLFIQLVLRIVTVVVCTLLECKHVSWSRGHQ